MPLPQTADINIFESENPGGFPFSSEYGPTFPHTLEQLLKQLLLHGYSVSIIRRSASS